jgi:hypothetical protein
VDAIRADSEAHGIIVRQKCVIICKVREVFFEATGEGCETGQMDLESADGSVKIEGQKALRRVQRSTGSP